MQKIIIKSLFVFIILFFSMCSHYNIKYESYDTWMHQRAKIMSVEWIKKIDAVDAKYSILTFTNGFNETNIKIINGNDTLFTGELSTIESMGYSSTFRINNNFDTTIFDNNLKKPIIIKRSLVKNYKNVYVSKSKKRNQKYTLTFSNDFKVFM
jgi:hypothetical protein